MSITPEQYKKMYEKAAPPSKSAKNYVNAFLIGGIICIIGQALNLLFTMLLKLPKLEAGTYTSVSLIALASVFTAMGWYEKIAVYGGAGTHVPITGFANTVTASAMEARSEGLIF